MDENINTSAGPRLAQRDPPFERNASAADEIKSRLTMRDLFAAYGFEQGRGGFISCPFHAEKTPSLSVYDHGQKWKCFGCGEQGDVISFVMKLFQLPFPKACERLDSDFHLGLYRTRTFQQARKEKRERQRQRQIRRAEAQNSARDRMCRKIFSKYHGWLWHQPNKTKETLFDLEYTERMIASERMILMDPYSCTAALSSKHENGGEWVDLLARNRDIW